MRLDKMLAHLGYGSRKEVKEFIRKGYVLVNGIRIKDDDYKVDETMDEIQFLEQQIHYEHLLYFILNKPAGYVSATYDAYDPIVLDLIEGHEKRGLFPVGRLDKDTTGLLLITNDGNLAHQLLSPSKHVDKAYEVTFSGEYQTSFAVKFKEGILLDDGYKCLPASFKLLESHHGIITIQEGKYHQVKRMFEALGMNVLTLKRVSFGCLTLPDDLKEGQYRSLTEQEKNKLIAKGE